MKKFLFMFLSSVIMLFGIETKDIPQGWSLNGVGLSENALNPTTFSQQIKTIWKYTNGKWQAYSHDNSTKILLQNAGIEELESINQGEGFWINSESNTTFTSSVLSKYATSSYETTEDSSYDDYTYNYTVEGGLIQSDRIAWDKASSLQYATDFNETTLTKTIPKVFYSVDKKVALIVNSQDCSEDITIAVTPYSSINSMPGISDVLKESYSGDMTSNTSSKTSTDTMSSAYLTSYTSSNKTVEILKHYSADISVEDSNGDKISPKNLDAICSNVEAYALFGSSEALSDFNESAIYTLHYINGYNDINATNVTLENLTKKIKLPTLPNFKPFYISKQTNETVSQKSDLNVTLSGQTIFTAKVDAITLSTFIGDSNPTEDITGYDKNYEITMDEMKYYISPMDVSPYVLFGYDGTWNPITSQTTGMYSKFALAKAQSTSGSGTCEGAVQIESCGENITMDVGEINFYNIYTVTGSVQVMSSDPTVATVSRETTDYVDELKVIAYKAGTTNIAVSDNNGVAYLFLTVTDATPETTIINNLTWLDSDVSDTFTHDEAASWCQVQGYRLPTKQELYDIWNYYSVQSPPGFAQNMFYWASEQYWGVPMDISTSALGGDYGSTNSNGHRKCVKDN